MNTVADLPALDRPALIALWTRTFRSPPPANMSQDMMRRFIAFEIQAKRQGGIAPKTRKALDRASARRDRTPSGRGTAPCSPIPGTRLVREWNGTAHHVEITEDGCRWQGRAYRSLSAIAREITGARWSGPRFFGLIPGKSGQPR